jgi:phospholipase C
VDRREFIRATASTVGAAALGPLLAACGLDERDRDAERALGADRLLDRAASDAPVDTVVIAMLENRSFDHYLGWLGSDHAYLDAGRSRYGHAFHVSARQRVRYTDARGDDVTTQYLIDAPDETDPYRGCGRRVPGHGWETGRIERDHGFAAAGTGNDAYALGYYNAGDVDRHDVLARRFTVADHSFSSLLAGTFPNRQYMHAATSLGMKSNPPALDVGVYGGETIWDRLERAGVDARYYYVDLPFLALWGDRFDDRISPIDDYFDDAEKGKLPNVVMVDPGFEGPDRSDNHPHGDIRVAQRYLSSVFAALARSPQWTRSLFVLTYDEWGGFFDHVAPPTFPDDRASRDDDENFGQAGFRVPTILASPYARRGFVDARPYDHTSILRFIEWRFLGAPPEGPRAPNGPWHLTARDLHAHNIGASLVARADAEIDFDLDAQVAEPSTACLDPERPARPDELGPADVIRTPAFQEKIDAQFPPATARPWL